MAEARKKLKSFDGRAATLLKQTSEISTLCASPACIVIYNPDDVIRPWRIWPDNEAEFRSFIQMYKTTKKNRKRHRNVKTNPSRRRGPKAAAGVDVASSIPPSSSFQFPRSTIPNPIGDNELLIHQLTPQAMYPTTNQARFPPLLPASTLDRHLVLAGNFNTLAGNVDSIATDSTVNADVVGIHPTTSIAADATYAGVVKSHSLATVSTTDATTAGQFTYDLDLDRLLSCEWDDNEMFELDELLNSNNNQEMMMF